MPKFPQKLKCKLNIPNEINTSHALLLQHHALTAAETVLLTSRFFATGAMLQVVRNFFGIDKSTAGRTVYKVILGLDTDFIQLTTDCGLADVFASQGFGFTSSFLSRLYAVRLLWVKLRSVSLAVLELFASLQSGYAPDRAVHIFHSNLECKNL
nr:unnamed protein product [Callosobruchus analis]